MGLLGEGGDLYAFFNTADDQTYCQISYQTNTDAGYMPIMLSFLLTTILTLAQMRLLKCIKIKDQLTVLQVSIVQTNLQNRIQQSSIMASKVKNYYNSRGEKSSCKQNNSSDMYQKLHHKIERYPKIFLDEKFKRSYKKIQEFTYVHIFVSSKGSQQEIKPSNSSSEVHYDATSALVCFGHCSLISKAVCCRNY